MRSSPLAAAPAEQILRQLTARSGLVFRGTRRADAEASIGRVLREIGVDSPETYADEVDCGKRSLDPLIERLTVGETYFFRDPVQFDFIREEILPELDTRRGPHHTLRIWSAGCSSGEEPYSLAILLAESGVLHRSRILATDIARASLDRAREARYKEWAFRGCPAGLRQRYFRASDGAFVLADALRRQVAFERLNLAMDLYPSPLNGTAATDLILLRNVLIYFSEETIREVARRMFESLATGGWLVTGASDPSLSPYAPFETVVTDRGIYYRRPTSSPNPLPARAQDPQARRPQTRRPSARSPAYPVPAAVRPLLPEAEDEAAAAARQVRDLANRAHVEEAVAAAATMSKRFPLSPEIHFVHAVLLVNEGRDGEALHVLRRVLYLDARLAIAHFLAGVILQRSGSFAEAGRAYRNAKQISAEHSPDEPVPFAGGEVYRSLAVAIDAHMRLIREPEKEVER